MKKIELYFQLKSESLKSKSWFRKIRNVNSINSKSLLDWKRNKRSKHFIWNSIAMSVVAAASLLLFRRRRRSIRKCLMSGQKQFWSLSKLRKIWFHDFQRRLSDSFLIKLQSEYASKTRRGSSRRGANGPGTFAKPFGSYYSKELAEIFEAEEERK